MAISYAAVGSGAGITAFSAGQANFGASDVPMTASEQAAARGPLGTGARRPGRRRRRLQPEPAGGARLHLTGPVIARIFLGQITSGTTRPSPPSTPASASRPRRSPSCTAPTAAAPPTSSATTSSSVDPAWAAKVGTGKTLHWPAGEGAEGNGSVAATVYETPFSIGYVETAYSHGLLLPYAAIRNQAGHYVTATTQAIAADAAQKPHITPADFSIVNQPGASSYPISGYSWALVYTHQPNQATGQALVSMLDWLTHDGQAYAAATSYVPLPPQIQQLARTMLQQVTGPTGTHLLG